MTHRFFRLDNFIHGPEQSWSEEDNWNNKINKFIPGKMIIYIQQA